MIIDDFDIPNLSVAPYEADPPLIIDADAVLAVSRTAQRFKAVARRDSEIIQPLRRIERLELRPRAPLDLVGQAPDRMAGKQGRRALVDEALDHGGRSYRKSVRSAMKIVPCRGTQRRRGGPSFHLSL